MIKRVTIIFIICLSLLFPGLTWGILYYYSGTMDSTFEIEHEFTIIVPSSGITSITVITPLPEDYSLPNNSQEITDLDFTYSLTPSVEDYTDIYENHYRKFIWTNPPVGTITAMMSYTASTSSDWSELETSDGYPFDRSGLPDSVTDFIQPSEKVQSDDPDFIILANTLTSGLTTQWEALAALNGWVINNISYGTNPYGIDALSTYDLGFGNCSNYAHIVLALVRAAGIPARFVGGYALSKSYSLPTGDGLITANWSQGSHAWIEVYYPSLGWIPYDPQRDHHHVDTHRILVSRGADTTGTGGDFDWTFDSAPSSYPDAYYTLNVNWIDDSIALSYIKSTSESDKKSFSTAVPFIQDHTISASSGTGGSILPDGSIGVINGSNQTFTITPAYGYQIEDVLVDGASQGQMSSYTFNNLTADHTISVQFRSEESHSPRLSGLSGSSCLIDTIRF